MPFSLKDKDVTRETKHGKRVAMLSSNGFWYCYWDGKIYGYTMPTRTLQFCTQSKKDIRRWFKTGKLPN